MTESEAETALALVASPNFAWRPGMLDARGGRVVEVEQVNCDPSKPAWWCVHGCKGHNIMRIARQRGAEWVVGVLPGTVALLPDITDDGTRGALEGLACRLWDAPLAQVSPALDDGAYWVFYHNKPGVPEPRITGPTKGEAWARAVIAAPK